MERLAKSPLLGEHRTLQEGPVPKGQGLALVQMQMDHRKRMVLGQQALAVPGMRALLQAREPHSSAKELEPVQG